MKHEPIFDQLEAHRQNADIWSEVRPVMAENRRLREALKTLLDCGNAIIGASTSDPDAAEAFEMYDDARRKARSALLPQMLARDGDHK